MKFTVLLLFILSILVPVTLQMKRNKRFLKTCSSDTDCSSGECCAKSLGPEGYCKPGLPEGDYCRVSAVCPKCGEGLYCNVVFMFLGRCTSTLKTPQ